MAVSLSLLGFFSHFLLRPFWKIVFWPVKFFSSFLEIFVYFSHPTSFGANSVPCMSVITGVFCPMQESCPCIHITPEGYQKRRLWIDAAFRTGRRHCDTMAEDRLESARVGPCEESRFYAPQKDQPDIYCEPCRSGVFLIHSHSVASPDYQAFNPPGTGHSVLNPGTPPHWHIILIFLNPRFLFFVRERIRTEFRNVGSSGSIFFYS